MKRACGSTERGAGGKRFRRDKIAIGTPVIILVTGDVCTGLEFAAAFKAVTLVVSDFVCVCARESMHEAAGEEIASPCKGKPR